LGNVSRLLISVILIFLTCSFRLNNFERDTLVDIWQTGSEYDYTLPSPDNRVNCEDNDLDEDNDSQFVQVDPKLYKALEDIKKQSGTSADTCPTGFGRHSVHTYRETLFERTDFHSDTPYLASPLLRAPPSLPA
jgi:hypothetical protein